MGSPLVGDVVIFDGEGVREWEGKNFRPKLDPRVTLKLEFCLPCPRSLHLTKILRQVLRIPSFLNCQLQLTVPLLLLLPSLTNLPHESAEVRGIDSKTGLILSFPLPDSGLKCINEGFTQLLSVVGKFCC